MVLLTSSSALLTLILLVVSVDGGRGTVEGESVGYLRPRDLGRLQYELTVGSETRTIEVGTAEVVSVGKERAEIRLTSDRQILPGFAVRFELPLERVREAEPRVSPEALQAAVSEMHSLSARVAELEKERENLQRALEAAGARAAEASLALRAAEAAQEADAPDPEPARIEAADRIEARVRAWAAAWSSQDVQTYLSFYVEGYQPSSGVSHTQWRQTRAARLQAPSFIEIDIDGLELQPSTARRIEARFAQSYRSDSYQDRVAKVLELVLVDGEWKISKEAAR